MYQFFTSTKNFCVLGAMNESALVWGLEAEEREGVAVMELVDEEIALLQEDIAILRRALLNDDVDLRLATPARENRAKGQHRERKRKKKKQNKQTNKQVLFLQSLFQESM